MAMTPAERIAHYHAKTKFPTSLCITEDGSFFGMFVMGNSYRVSSGYYGGYPASYLKRIDALFPDRKNVLHLFSGQVDVKTFPGDTVDLDDRNNPTYVDDAQSLENVPVWKYDLILADPPYSVEDSEHYMPSMVKRNKVMDALGKRASSGTFVVWLDQVLPMYRKADWDIVGRIGMSKSTNHRFRVVTIFQRKRNTSGDDL